MHIASSERSHSMTSSMLPPWQAAINPSRGATAQSGKIRLLDVVGCLICHCILPCSCLTLVHAVTWVVMQAQRHKLAQVTH